MAREIEEREERDREGPGERERFKRVGSEWGRILGCRVSRVVSFVPLLERVELASSHHMNWSTRSWCRPGHIQFGFGSELIRYKKKNFIINSHFLDLFFKKILLTYLMCNEFFNLL